MVPAWVRAWCSIAACGFVVALSGCASASLNATVGDFGNKTMEAVKAQKAELLAYQSADAERIKQRYAASREKFRIGEGCRPDSPAIQCRLLDQDGQPVEESYRGEAALALGEALGEYAAGLVLLAADTKADETAFATSLTNLASSVGSLEGAIARASKAGTTPPSNLGAVATIVATAGNLYFKASREQALRRIIIQSDPVVHRATARLSATQGGLQTQILQDRILALEAAQTAHRAAIAAGAKPDVIRARVGDLFTAYERVRTTAATSEGFAELGKAHAALARLAATASAADLFDAIERLAEAAKSISQAAGKLTT